MFKSTNFIAYSKKMVETDLNLLVTAALKPVQQNSVGTIGLLAAMIKISAS